DMFEEIANKFYSDESPVSSRMSAFPLGSLPPRFTGRFHGAPPTLHPGFFSAAHAFGNAYPNVSIAVSQPSQLVALHSTSDSREQNSSSASGQMQAPNAHSNSTKHAAGNSGMSQQHHHLEHHHTARYWKN